MVGKKGWDVTMDKRAFKKTGEELQQYLAIMRKHHIVENKKGKGSFKRHPKHKGEKCND